jgi:ketosteroid isomerase-like protein
MAAEHRWRDLSTMLRSVIMLSVATALVASVAAAEKDDVWKMEEAYWRYVKAGEVDAYISLWHEDFVGWPCSTLQPSRKANIGDWVREIRDKGVKVTCELHREAVQYFGDVAVVHYSTPLVYEYPDGKITGEGELLKFTHTWMKVNGQWLIIGGMCGVLKPTVR